MARLSRPARYHGRLALIVISLGLVFSLACTDQRPQDTSAEESQLLVDTTPTPIPSPTAPPGNPHPDFSEAYARAFLATKIREMCSEKWGGVAARVMRDRILATFVEPSDAYWVSDHWQFVIRRELPLNQLVSGERYVVEELALWGNGIMAGSFLNYLENKCES